MAPQGYICSERFLAWFAGKKFLGSYLRFMTASRIKFWTERCVDDVFAFDIEGG
jgi:hypothetical protein